MSTANATANTTVDAPVNSSAIGSLALPPMLSPTLPPEWDGLELPEEPLSPTLPPQYTKESKLKDARDSRESREAKESRDLKEKVKKSLIVKLQYPKPAPKIKASDDSTSKTKKRPSITREYSSSSEEELPKYEESAELPKKSEKLHPPGSSEKTQKSLSDTPASPEKKSLSPPPPEHKELVSKLKFWVDQARKKKHEADAAMDNRKHRLAALVSVDSVICFIRAFDCEDRASVLAHRSPHARSWETLIPYLGKLLVYLESVDADIAGVCYQVRALLFLHLGNVLKKSKNHTSANNLTPESALFSCISDFKRGLALLPTKSVGEKYRLKWTKNIRNKKAIDPETDRCVLPLHVNSTLQDVAAFALHLTREWASHESIEYEWAAAEAAEKVNPSNS